MSAALKDLLKGPWLIGSDTSAVSRFWEGLPGEASAGLDHARQLLDCVVSTSPYLRSLLLHWPSEAVDYLGDPPEQTLGKLLDETRRAAFSGNLVETAKTLRQTKARIALLLALADIGRAWNVEQVTAALSQFADAAVQSAVNALLLDYHASGKLILNDIAHPSMACGYAVIAMGKHGACELNYSSDIDLVVLFDPTVAPVSDGRDVALTYIQLTKKLVGLLQDIDEHGYVFRTDLRLRPDPRATQVAISIEAAAHYYENLGQNWERAAYIKARAMAGDIDLGEEFLARLRPYIWRKYLDFASIADVQSLIRQIHAVKGHGEIAVEGHNLKLGRGGIREIEFFVQTQQLIAGGRNPALRGRSTIAMLDELAAANWVSSETATDLQQCYRHLRTFEHRAQMVDDQQTHLVPAKPEAFENYARLCGFASGADLATSLRTILEIVQRHTSRLFETSGSLGSDGGSLVFTGGEDDPDTLATLSRMGFHQSSEVSATIRGWHYGRYAATRTRRAREDLTELLPALLAALARDGDADRAFIEFDRFLSRLGAGVQLFAMLKANPALLELIARILGTAPRLAEGLGRQPRILEAVLEPGFFGSMPSRAQLQASLLELIPQGLALEEAMDRARVFGREQHFRVGVRVLSDTVSAEDAGEGFANLADVLIDRLLSATLADLVAKHGSVEAGRVAIVAMGKLGGREMTAASDLDLILIYDHPQHVLQTDGAKPLAVGQYYQRLTQRFISALTAPTSEGALYEVDLRLRPSGSKGPVAASFASFKTYHAESAWTWEKLALTRARVVAGDASLMEDVRAEIAETLQAKRHEADTRRDVVDMRGLMLREHNPHSVWDIKRVRGGLVELEFIAQFLQLLHAHAVPALLNTNTMAAFDAFERQGILPAAEAQKLREASRLFHRLTQVLRLCLDDVFEPQKALAGLNRAIARAANVASVSMVEDLLREHQEQVAALFDRIVGTPSQKN